MQEHLSLLLYSGPILHLYSRFLPQICLLVFGAHGGQDTQGTLWLEQPLALDWPSFPGQTLAEMGEPWGERVPG